MKIAQEALSTFESGDLDVASDCRRQLQAISVSQVALPLDARIMAISTFADLLSRAGQLDGVEEAYAHGLMALSVASREIGGDLAVLATGVADLFYSQADPRTGAISSHC